MLFVRNGNSEGKRLPFEIEKHLPAKKELKISLFSWKSTIYLSPWSRQGMQGIFFRLTVFQLVASRVTRGVMWSELHDWNATLSSHMVVDKLSLNDILCIIWWWQFEPEEACTSVSITILGCYVNIKSMQNIELSSTCVGSFITCESPN